MNELGKAFSDDYPAIAALMGAKRRGRAAALSR
jgi:hypothetical protein